MGGGGYGEIVDFFVGGGGGGVITKLNYHLYVKIEEYERNEVRLTYD